MNYDDVKFIVKDILKAHNCQGVNAAAHKIARRIMDEMGDAQVNKTWNLMHAFPPDLEPIVRKIERGTGLMMPRTDTVIEIYRWVQEQPEKELNEFIKWATAPDRVQYIGKYKNSPGLIKTDWGITKSTPSPRRRAERLS